MRRGEHDACGLAGGRTGVAARPLGRVDPRAWASPDLVASVVGRVAALARAALRGGCRAIVELRVRVLAGIALGVRGIMCGC